MEQTPCEANSHSAIQEITRLLWNPKVHYSVHKDLSLVPILNQMNPDQTIPTYFFNIILILSSHLYLGLPSASYPMDTRGSFSGGRAIGT